MLSVSAAYHVNLELLASVELGYRIEFMGRKWRIARTLKKTVWLAIRPENRGFYVLEERPDPTNLVVPRILLAHRF